MCDSNVESVQPVVCPDDGSDERTRPGRRRWLDRRGYRLTDRECPDETCEGELWYDSHELVCGDCSYVIDMSERRRRSGVNIVSARTRWKNFWADRRNEDVTSSHYYDNDDVVKCVGGFLSAYDWTTSDETDGPVSAVDPTEFYR